MPNDMKSMLVVVIVGLLSFSGLNFNYLTPEQTVIAVGIIGTLLGIIHNTEYVRKTKTKGITIALIAIILWILVINVILEYWKLLPTVANFLAFTGGIFIFYTLTWTMERQPQILDFIFRIFFGWLQKRYTGTDIKPIEFTVPPDKEVEKE